MNISVLQIFYNVCTSCLHHATKVLGILCVLSICTMYWIYFNVSGQPGQFTNRRELITNPHRWNVLQNVSQEKVWPRTFGETDDRILSQLRFMDYYASLPANRTMKRILRVGLMNFEGLPEGQEVFVNEKCPIQECTVTYSESESHLVDALLISEMSFYNWLHYLPKPPHQLWIAQHWESAGGGHDHFLTWLIGHNINWTVSYRRDSTLGISYGKYIRMSNVDTSPETVDYSKGKVKQVAWFVNNCRATNNRLEYAHELAKYIEVDIYGYCGTLTCNKSISEICHRLLDKYYRFYLAFENSNCKDYITEKLFHTALKHNVIPIVMGARPEDYAALAPPGSYIHVSNFSGPQELAQYLKLLAANPDLYNKYFEWRKSWSQMINDRHWCRLCMMLHLREDIGYFAWFEDYRLWWNSVCGTSSLYCSSLVTVLNVVIALLAGNRLLCHTCNGMMLMACIV